MNAKRLFLGLLTATIVLAPLGTLKPASATEQSNNQLMAQTPKSGQKRPASSSPNPGRSLKRVRLDSPDVTSSVQSLPDELKLNIMQHMTWGHYQAMKNMWHLPAPSQNLQQQMHQNTDDHQMAVLVGHFTNLSIQE